MERTTTSADLRDTLYGSMELSKNTWLLASNFPTARNQASIPLRAETQET